MLHYCIYYLQFLLRGTGQLQDVLQCLLCMKFCKFMGKFLLCLL